MCNKEKLKRFASRRSTSRVKNMYNLKLKIKKREEAFTFIEILAAIAVLAVGLLSVVALSSKSYAAISLQRNKLIATKLAKEEMEIILNVRNENWLYNNNTSYCTPSDDSGVICNGVSPNPNGRKSEDNGDCDWRCGSKNVAPLANPNGFFRLESTTSSGIKDLDYAGNVQKGVHGDDCQNQGIFLYLDNVSGFYKNTNDGNDFLTPFKRLVTIKRDIDANGDGNPNNDIEVVVSVCWRERGRWSQVSAEEHLFNWMR